MTVPKWWINITAVTALRMAAVRIDFAANPTFRMVTIWIDSSTYFAFSMLAIWIDASTNLAFCMTVPHRRIKLSAWLAFAVTVTLQISTNLTGMRTKPRNSSLSSTIITPIEINHLEHQANDLWFMIYDIWFETGWGEWEGREGEAKKL